jgi:hypothetical protein
LCISLYALSGSTAWSADLIRIGISDKRIDSFFDMPLGVHQIPKTNIIYSQTPKTANVAELDKALSLDINDITRTILQDQFKGKDPDGGFTISGGADGDLLEVTPWILLNISDEGMVTPWVVWNVEYWDQYWGKMKWKGFCVACLSLPEPLEGQGGWVSKGREYLEQAIDSDCSTLLRHVKTDLKGGFKKNQFQTGRLKAVWMFGKKSKEIDVDFTGLDPETILVKNLGDQDWKNFEGGGLTGLLLKKAFPNSVLLNGALIIPNDFGEPIEETPSPATPSAAK